MYPVLFKVGDFEVRSYGILLLIGILLAVWWSRRRAPRWGIQPDRVVDATFWGIVPGILGARIGYILQEWGYYSQNPGEIWTWKFAGLTSFGGVVMAIAGLLFYARRARISALAFLDVVSLPLLVAHAVGRLGCLLNGCCYGHPTTAWYGVPVEFVEGLFEPAQVYEAFLVMVGVGFLLLFERRPRSLGSSFSLALVVWGAARFIYEFFRAGTVAEVEKGVASSTYWGSLPLTQAHVAALVLVVIGLLMLWRVSRVPRPVEVTE
jgi:phosphatidylglycerol:prolipoprotein diacylglycerol transferase